MAKDMYQKRRERKEKAMSNDSTQQGCQKNVINWYPGHMAKTKREIKENLSLIDIVYELVDARIPFSSKNNDFEEFFAKKPRVLIMTKKDLCDMDETLKYKAYYENSGINVVLVNSLNKDNISLLLQKTKEIANSLNEKRKKQGMLPRRVRILILGIPNVGKSTLINTLVGKKATNVGNKPGVTKNLNWIRINNDFELLDTPGVLWPKLSEEVAFNLGAMTSIKEEVLNIDEIAIYIIKKMLSFYPNLLKERYNLGDKLDIDSVLYDIALKIGAFRNKEVDYDKVYMTVFRDLRDGYLGKVTFDRL